MRGFSLRRDAAYLADISEASKAISAICAGRDAITVETDLVLRAAVLHCLTVVGCGGVLEPTIAGVYLASPLISLRSLVEVEQCRHPLSNFVPGLPRKAVLPQMARSTSPRPVALAAVLSGSGAPAPSKEVARNYGEGKHLRILPNAEWSGSGIPGHIECRVE